MAPKPISDELQSLIQSTTPANLKKEILAALPKSSEADLKMLLSMLAPLAKSATAEKHCVRCHTTFFDHTNGPDACVIVHNSEGSAERTEIGSDEMTITLECCDFEYSDDDCHPEDTCYVAHHTTNTDDVDYFEGGEKAEDGDEGSNDNVVRCEERDCMAKKQTKRKGASISRSAPGTKKQKGSSKGR